MVRSKTDARFFCRAFFDFFVAWPGNFYIFDRVTMGKDTFLKNDNWEKYYMLGKLSLKKYYGISI